MIACKCSAMESDEFDAFMQDTTMQLEEMAKTCKATYDHLREQLDPGSALAAKFVGPADGPAHAAGPEGDDPQAAGPADPTLPPWKRDNLGPWAAP